MRSGINEEEGSVEQGCEEEKDREEEVVKEKCAENCEKQGLCRGENKMIVQLSTCNVQEIKPKFPVIWI